MDCVGRDLIEGMNYLAAVKNIKVISWLHLIRLFAGFGRGIA